MIKKTNRKKVIHCNLSEICTSVVFNPDITVLVHAPRSCSNIIYNAITNMRRRINLRFGKALPSQQDNIFMTGISDKEAIFGGEKLLKNSIQAVVEEKHPECLLVVAGCTANVIGDDVAAVCEAASQEYKLPIIYIPGAGFMSEQSEEGILLATKYLYKKIADNSVPKDEQLVAVIGMNQFVQTEEQMAELQRLFGYFGFTRVLLPPCGMSLTQLQELNRASLLAIHAMTKDKLRANQQFVGELAGYLQIPGLENRLPFSRQETDAYLLALGEMLHAPAKAEQAIELEHQRWRDECQRLARSLGGVHYILAIGHALRVTNPLQIIDCAEAVGMVLEKIVYLDSLTEAEIKEYETVLSQNNINSERIKEAYFPKCRSQVLVLTSDYRGIFSKQYCYKRKRIGVGGAVNLLKGISSMLKQGGLLKYE
ncbi:MAG: nitrogenase component 1 [Phascolarctobacterium sp.]|nr:nitrogenase component 1 [Phascolarctobacterium sp.]